MKGLGLGATFWESEENFGFSDHNFVILEYGFAGFSEGVGAKEADKGLKRSLGSGLRNLEGKFQKGAMIARSVVEAREAQTEG